MKNRIPIVLIFARLLIGGVLIILSAEHIDHYRVISITLLTIGLLTDILDGIIARWLKISTQNLRRLDSTVDQLFFLSVGFASYIQCPDFFRSNSSFIIILLGSEALCYLICFLKFRREIATHSIGAKLWTLILFATLIEVMVHCTSDLLFTLFFWAGLLTRFEIIAIILIVKKWTTDVPTFYHAWKLRQGKEIKRHRFFNG